MTGDSEFADVDFARLWHQPEAVARFVGELMRDVRVPSKDRRSEARCRITAPALLQSIDEQGRPVGAPHEVMIRDISPSGIGIIGSQQLRTRYFALQLTTHNGDRFHVIVEALRDRRIGAYHDIGGRFIIEEPRAEDKR